MKNTEHSSGLQSPHIQPHQQSQFQMQNKTPLQNAVAILNRKKYLGFFNESQLQKILSACQGDPKFDPVVNQIHCHLKFLDFQKGLAEIEELLNRNTSKSKANDKKAKNIDKQLSQSTPKWLSILPRFIQNIFGEHHLRQPQYSPLPQEQPSSPIGSTIASNQSAKSQKYYREAQLQLPPSAETEKSSKGSTLNAVQAMKPMNPLKMKIM